MYQVYDDMSEAELLVCDYLKQMRVFWIYEQPVFLSDNANRPRIFAPDFYLPELGVYIEVMGNPHLPDYERRSLIYQKNNIPIIFIAPFHDRNWQMNIFDFIENVHQERYEKVKRIRANIF